MAGALPLPDNIVQVGSSVDVFSMLLLKQEGWKCTRNGCPFRRTLVMLLWEVGLRLMYRLKSFICPVLHVCFGRREFSLLEE